MDIYRKLLLCLRVLGINKATNIKWLYLLGFFVIIGCYDIEIQKCSYKIKTILLDGTNKLAIAGEKDNLVDGKLVSTKIMFDNKGTLEYLNKKYDILFDCYSKVKNNYQKSANTDALYVLALTNEVMCFLTGKPIEDRAKYLDDLQAKENHELSLWLMDDIFGPILRTDEELLEEWISLDKNVKYVEIYSFLTSPAPQ